ncbi:sugar phosphate nucleotidyltransferase [Pseudonocardia sp. CA-107938]|uniref:sugar phosphate nucleotidyltransferase n=1 Tax=Pseudonocardia sp. CA-107938 TaxID=3240021 RepID=UPI003D8F9AA3
MSGRRAVVLAGGLGTRLRPYTAVIPKPLLPVGEQPILEIVLRQLREHGFEHVSIATGHLAQLIEAFFGDGSAFDLKIDYFREREALGTVGALAMMEGLEEPFLVMNGDVLTDLDYSELLDDHVDSGAAATIAARAQEVQVSLGVLHFADADDGTRITDYVEKPAIRYEASMGVYCFSPRAVDQIVPGERLDFPELILRLIRSGETVRAWRSDAYWLDIGRHDDYERAMEEFERMRHRLLPEPQLIGPASIPAQLDRLRVEQGA